MFWSLRRAWVVLEPPEYAGLQVVQCSKVTGRREHRGVLQQAGGFGLVFLRQSSKLSLEEHL